MTQGRVFRRSVPRRPQRVACGLLFASLLVAGCGSDPTPPSPGIEPAPTSGIAIPAGSLPADTQCFVDHGFVVTALLPQGPGEQPGYKLETSLSDEEAAAVARECDKLEQALPERTDAQIREIYDRWVAERECLVGLGYAPDAPPTGEKFLDDYRHGPTGPWMPIDGVNTGAWSDSEYEQAKAACTLEMFSR